MPIQRRPILTQIRATRLTSSATKPTSKDPASTTTPTSLPADLLRAAISRGIRPAHQNQSTDEQTETNKTTLSTSSASSTSDMGPAKTATAAATSVTAASAGIFATGDKNTTTTGTPAAASAATATPAATVTATNSLLYRLALDGREPAESLPTKLRERLIRVLWGRGWTDEQISVHTRETVYVVARIRDRIGLVAHRGAA
jgi:hypothetical protein